MQRFYWPKIRTEGPRRLQRSARRFTRLRRCRRPRTQLSLATKNQPERENDAIKRNIRGRRRRRRRLGRKRPLHKPRNRPEERYSTVEKECLAIKLAVQAFRVYVLGRPFIVQTDHRALEWLDRVKENNGRLTRWSLSLQPYQFTVEYRPGGKNGNADSLSRMTCGSDSDGKAAGEGGGVWRIDLDEKGLVD